MPRWVGVFVYGDHTRAFPVYERSLRAVPCMTYRRTLRSLESVNSLEELMARSVGRELPQGSSRRCNTR
jgi:hypothetical protein